jgi:hypothetical protein
MGGLVVFAQLPVLSMLYISLAFCDLWIFHEIVDFPYATN